MNGGLSGDKSKDGLELYVHDDGKTECLPVVPKSSAGLIDGTVIQVGDFTITALPCVQNIGVFIDRNLDMGKHVSQTVSALAFYLCHMNQISHFLPNATKECIINTIIILWLYYCDSLIYTSCL